MKHESGCTNLRRHRFNLTALGVRMSLVFIILLFCSVKYLNAQTTVNKTTITGVVLDNLGEPLIGASVSEKGTTNATMTGIDGDFTLSVPSNGTITVTFVGFNSKDVPVNGQTNLKISLEEDSKLLEEVVVTALGIKRETKSLGYSMQELKGDALLESRESNVLNALSGKVSGLQVIRSSNGIGGSTKIVLRGSNSLTGSNQPLIVIDGVPMDNFTGGVDDAFGQNGRDMGSGLSDINQEDIESMSVLKGASAAALYGSRAGNGVILITTKSGGERPGIGVTINTGLSIETPFIKPKMQNSFGQGLDGMYNNQSPYTWGPKITGQTVQNWEGKDVKLSAYDNYDAFFRTGVSFNEGVSFQQNINGTSVFASLNRSDENGTTPEASIAKTSVNVRATSFLDKAKKWQIDAKANYVNVDAKNRPILGINPSNAYNTIYTLPVSIDMKEFKDRIYNDRGGMLWWYESDTPQENPYWVVKNRLNNDKRDRLLGTLKLKYTATDWLNLEISGGTDYYTTRTTEKVYAGSPNAKGGGLYNEGKEVFYENNYSFLAVARKDNLIDKLSASATAGGNLMFQGRDKTNGYSGQLLVENNFSLNNGINPATMSSSLVKRRMNSLYGVINLNWDNYLYFDVTARNDWSSTLSKDHNSYFYPSFNLAYIASEMLHRYDINMPSWISFAKIRGSYAVVGNDLDPYRLYNMYKMEKNNLGYNMIQPLSTTKFNSDVKSELIKSWEAGLDIRFLDGRIGLDATWYKKNATNQLLDIPLHPFSGYDRKIINAGNIQNTGIELAINGTILNTKNGLNWDATFNFSRNKDKIIELADGITTYQLHQRSLENIQIVAEAGGEYGAIYGQKYRRVTDKNSPHYSKIIVDKQGLPLFTTDKEYLGNQNPNAMIGITNNFSYKGFNLSFLVDMRLGGKIFSGTTAVMNKYGLGKETVVNGDRANFVVPNSVVEDGTGYAENTTATSPQKYWLRLTDTSAGGNFGLGEEFTYDATNIRLRNITLGYNFDKKLLVKTPFQRVRLSATCNNVWMIHSKLDGIDPESVTATNTNASGFEANGAPTSRTFVFNLTVGF